MINDRLVEGPETVTVSATAAASFGTIPSALLTITDNDVAPSAIVLSLSPTPVPEGNSATSTTTITVTASFSGSSSTLTDGTPVAVTVAGGTATAGTDFTAVPAFMVTIPAGETSGTATFDLAVTGDTVAEEDETVTVSGTAAASFGTIPSATVTITDDDTAPTVIELSLSPAAAAEGATTTVTVMATLSPTDVTLTADTVVTVAVGAGTGSATEGTDYTPVTDLTVTIVVGATSGTGSFDLTVADDTVAEPDETVTVSGTAGTFTIDPVTLTITDTDTDPTAITLSITPARALEGTTTTVMVTATLSPADITLAADTEVSISVGPGTAQAADFTATGNVTVTIPATLTSGTASFELVVVDDADPESDETVMVSGTAGTFTIDPVTLTITDNDTLPTEIVLSLSQDNAAEGASPTVTVTAEFPQGSVTLVTDTVVMVSVAANTAEAADFTAVTPFPVTIRANMISGMATFDLVVTDDTQVEGPETLTVSGDLTGYTIDPVTLTIIDDDNAPDTIILSLSSSVVTEGDDGTSTPAVMVTAALAGGVTLTDTTVVTISVTGVGTNAATAMEDFAAFTDLEITIPINQNSITAPLNLMVIGDRQVEEDETLMVSGSAGSYTIDPVTLTIENDDDAPATITLSLSVPSVTEGDDGTSTPAVTVTASLAGGVTLTAATVVTVSVVGGRPAAVPGEDFNAIPAFEITIPINENSITAPLNLVVIGDRQVEGNGTLRVSGSTSSLPVTPAALTLTILDDDIAPDTITLSLSPASVLSVSEGDVGTTTIEVTVTASLAGSVTLTDTTAVLVSVAGGGTNAATAGEDFNPVDAFQITIPANANSITGTFNLVVTGDTLVEGDETLVVSGFASSRYTVDPATVTIVDDDDAPDTITLSLSPASVLSVSEGDVGTTTTEVTVTASLPADSDTLIVDTRVTVSVGAGTDSATEGTDYTPVTDLTITIPAGETSDTATFDWVVTGDTVAEGDETLTVSGTATDFTIDPLTLTITDDDTAPTEITLSISPARAPEGEMTTVMVTAAYSGNVTLPGATEVTVSVAHDTAQAADFTAVPVFTLTIAALSSSITGSFDLAVTQDTDIDPDETLTVSGTTTATGFATINPATLTITDDDSPPTAIELILSQDIVAEGADPVVTVTAAFPQGSGTLTEATVVTVAVGDSGDTATEGTDYTTVDDFPVTIAVGATSGTATFPFAPTDDAVFDPGETVTVSGTATGFTFTNAMLAITNTDTAPTEIVLSLSQITPVTEGADPMITVTATLSGTVSLTANTVVTVSVGADGDTATKGTDYTEVVEFTVTIPATTLTGTNTFNLADTDDTLVEEDGETVTVSGMVGGITTITAITSTTLTITDNDDAPTVIALSLNPMSLSEAIGTPSVTVTASFSGINSSSTLSTGTEVVVTLADGTAVAGRDFTAVPAFTVTIPAGETSGTADFSLAVINDTLVEGPETVMVSGMVGGITTITAITSTTLTITDNDVAPTEIVLSLSQDTVAEGDSGSPITTITVTASFSGANSSSTLTDGTPVEVTVAGDTATEGTDFDRVSRFTFFIAAGETSGTGIFNLAVIGNTLAEADETLTVSGAAAGFTIDPLTLTITDTDTDIAPTVIALSLSEVGADEGARPAVTVTATLSPTDVTLPMATEVTVTVGDSGDTAVEGTDYTTVGDLTVTIAAGATSGTGTFQFEATDDAFADTGETVTVSGTADGFTIDPLTLTITDDDVAPMSIVLSLSEDDVAEGASPTVEVRAVFDPAGAVLEVDTTVSVVVGADGDTATEGTDYSTVADFTFTIPGLATGGNGTFVFAVTDDPVADTGETVTVSGTAAPFTIDPVMLTITDDDEAPTEIVLSLSQDSVAEGASPMVTVTATLSPTSVTLPGATMVTVAVGADGDMATEGTDYTEVEDFTVTIDAGATSGTGIFEFAVTDDAFTDPDETVTVSGTVGTFAITSATLTVTDDDVAPTAIVLSHDRGMTNEGGNQVTTVTAAFVPAGAALEVDTTVSVVVGDSGDTATERTDYTEVDDFTVTIDAGTTSGTGTFTFVVAVDAVYDPNETVTVSATAAGFDPITSVTLDINDQNTAPTEIALSLSPDNVAEGDAALNITVTATLSGTVSLTADTVVTVTVAGTTATTGTDYTAPSSVTITIPATMTSGMGVIAVQVVNDTLAEGPETVTVSGTVGGTTTITTVTSATLTITDNDMAPTMIALSLSETGADEGASPTVTVMAAFSGTVSLPADTVVTVTVGDTGDSATEVTDYIPVADLMVTIAAGTTSGTGTFQFVPTDDTVAEPDEIVTVSGTAAGFDPIASVTLAITDTDTAPTVITLSATPLRVAEGASPTVTVTATLSPTSVTLPVATEVIVSVGIGTAQAVDFTAVTNVTVTIPATMTSGTATFDLTVADDLMVEGDETLMVSGTATDFTITPATLTIDDTDTAPTSIILSLTPTGGADEDATTTVTVMAAYPAGSAVVAAETVVAVTVTGGTAEAAGTDFDDVTGITVTIPATMTSGTATFDLVVAGDELAEGPETVSVSGTATDFTVTSATLTINDIDVAPTAIFLNFTPTNLVEGSSGTTTTTEIDVQAAFFGSTVTLLTDTVVTVSVAGGTATAGTDFTAVPGFTIIIPALMDSGRGTFDLEVNGDTLVEMNETVTVSGAATGFMVLTGFTSNAGQLTIENDDAAPTAIALSLDPTSVIEDSGTTSVTVTAAFSGSSSILTTATEVTVSVAPGTTEMVDFTAVPAFTVTIPANMSSGTASFNLAVVEDTLVEGAETVTVSGAATGFTISDTALTITDNDTAPTNIALSVSPAAVLEGDSGDTTTPITVTASFAGSSTLTEATVVSVTVSSGTRPDRATVGVDYRSVTDFTVTIPAGASSGTNSFDWVVIGGTVFDGDETVTVSGTAAPFTVDPATLTITEDDEAPTTIVLSLNPASVTEGTTTTIAVTATLPGSVSLTSATEVAVSVAAGTASTVDFTAVTAFTVTIPANMLTGTANFSLVVTEDTVADPDETLTVSGTVASFTITSATLTIDDNDTAPTAITLSAVPTSVPEGVTTSVAVTATLSGSVSLTSATEVAVSVAAGTATAGTDFTAVPAFTVTIPANMLTGTASFNLTVAEDTVADPNETLTVSGTATDFTITSATLAITDNDTAPTAITLSTVPISVPEGATTPVAVTATLSGSVSLTSATEVMVSVAAGTATAVTDFTAVPAFTVTIPANMLTGTASFNLTVTEDTVADPDETVTVSGTVAPFDITSAILTITDNDTAPSAITLSTVPASVPEGVTTSVAVTATLSGSVSLTSATEVAVSVVADTATAVTDFTAVPAFTVTIPANMLTGTASFNLTVAEDTVADPDETVTVTGTVAPFDITSATLTITDNDTAPSAIVLSLNPSTPVDEGASAMVTVTAAFSGTVSLPGDTVVMVTVGDTGDSATEGTDYSTIADITVTIAAGATSGEGTFLFAPTDDTVEDPDETVTVSATAAASFGTISSVMLAITNTDTAPTEITLSTVPTSVPEGAMTSVAVTATLSGSVSLTSATEVTVSVAAGTASTADFTDVTDFMVTIPANMLTGTASFNLVVTEDTVADPNETLTVSGTATGFTTINPATLTITDNDTASTAITLSTVPTSVPEGATTTVAVTATLSGSVSLTSATDVAVSVVAGTATAGTDFTTVPAFTVTIPANMFTGTASFDLTVAEDTIADPEETVTVTGTVASFNITSATVTITDNDTAPSAIALSLSQSTPVDEGASAMVTVTAAFPGTVSLPGDTVVMVTVGDTGDSATEGTDYSTIADITVTIAAGATSGEGTFQFAPTNDTVADPGETVTVSATAAASFGTISSVMLAITNTDTAPTAITLSTVPTSVPEGATTTVAMTATLSGSVSLTSATEVTVSVAVGTASTADFTDVTDFMVTIPANMLTGTANFSLVATEDTVADPDETLTVSGTATGFTTINPATLTITDNDTAPTAITLSTVPTSVPEGATTTVAVTATLSGSVSLTSATDVAVSVAVGTASTADFSDVTDFTVTIPANMLTGTANFSLVVTEDTVADPDETLTVSGTVASFNITSATLTITDNDDAPSAIVLSLNPSTPVAEGTSATVTVTATLSPAGVTLPDATVVTVAVGAGTDSATEGTDYGTVTDITVTIAAGATSGEGTFQFVPTDDTVADPNETLTVSGTATGFTITSAMLAITNTDTALTTIALSLSPTSVAEGATTTVAVTATLSGSVSLTSATDVAVSVAAGTASTADFTAVTAFTVTIPANMLTGTANFSLVATEDTVADPDETLTVSGTVALFTITSATLTIIDNDTASSVITLSTVPTSVTEGITTSVAVTATLAGTISLTSATEVAVSVAAGTASTADFTAVPAFMVTIPANMLTGTASFDVTVTEDTVADPDETLTVSGSAGGFTITAATLTITDNDTAPMAIVLSLSEDDVAEEAGMQLITVTATLSPTTVTLTADITVAVTVVGVTATTGTDFTVGNNFTITIAAGATSGTANTGFTPANDTVAEGPETLTFSGTAAGFTITAALLTITDNDTAPSAITLSLNPSTPVGEGSSATVTVTAAFAGTVSLPGDTVVTVTVGDTGDSATEGTDYTTIPDFTVTIAAGATRGEGTFQFAPTDDAVADPGETVTVSATAAASFGTIPSVMLAITNTDTAPTEITLSTVPTSVPEGVTTSVAVTATLSGSVSLTSATEVTVSVAAGTASTADFSDVTDFPVTIPANMLTGTANFSLVATEDTVADPNETLTVSGTATGFTTINPATLTITDNDTASSAITLSTVPTSVTEGATTSVAVTATLSGSVSLPSATDVTVSVAAGTASTADFTAVTAFTVTIPANMLTGTANFSLVVTEDTIADPDETVTVSGTVTGFTITPATVTITDNDTAPSAIVLSLNPSTPVAEGASATVTVTATLSPAGVTLPDATVVTVAVGAGTDSATEGTDYGTVTDITVTIAAGATSGEGTFQLAATDDTVADPNETLTVSGTASGFTFTSATLAITNTDTAPTAITLSTVPTSVPEGATTTVAVTATLSGSVSLTSATAVAVSVAAGTASTADFTAVTAFTVTIPANMLTGTANFSLVVTEDTVADPDETLTVSGTVALFTITSATLTITDNDTASSAITLSTVPTSVTEGATTSVAVTATLSGSVTLPSATEVTVSVAAGTASTADFTAVPAFTVTIPANMLTGTANFSLVVTEDTVADPNETLTVSGTATGFTITSATLAITDNDTAPTAITLSAVPTSVPEGATTSVAVTATLSGSVSLTSATEVTVSVAAGTATAGTDFTAVPAFTVTIPANMLAGTGSFNLPVTEDTIVDPNETLTVSATAAASFGTIPSVTLTITDDDTAPTTIALSLSPTSAAEGITTPVTVTAAYPGNVTLTTATEVTVSVAAGTAQVADFTAVSDFMVTIAAGATSGTATFDLVATDDTVFTSNKTVTVSGTATSYTVTSATLTIDDDETPPASVTLAVATVGESAGAVTVTATLDNEVVGGLTITVSTADGTATAGEDYTPPTVILMFAGTPGEIQTFPVTILGDIVVEGDETFTVSLTAPVTFPDTIDITSTATVTISDDEVNPTTVILSLAPDRVEEDSGTTTIAVTAAYPGGVTLTTATEVVVSVAGGTASAADFTAVSDFTLTIEAFSSSSTGSFDLTVTEDEESEGNETLTVSGAATGFDAASATLTILEVDSTAVVMEVVPELARLSVTSVIDAVADRVGRVVAGTANTLISFAGHQSLAPALAANEQRLNEGDLSWREVLKNSSFDLNLEGMDEEVGSGGGQAEPGGTVGIWASGGYENVSSRDALLGAWEGDLFSVHAGVDMRVSEHVLVGVAANRSKGSFEFDGNESLKTDSQLTAINPYFGWNSGDGAGLWATIGYGKGKVEVALDEPTDLTMRMVALGGSMDVSVGDEVPLTVKGEASKARLVTAATSTQEAVTANIQRLRLAVEVQDVTVQGAGEQFTRSAALGIRHDGGDGDTGLGAELDGELGWSVPATGVTLRATGHVLLAHQSDLKEWGVGGLIRYDVPGFSEGRGLSLRLQPSYGAESDSGQLWEHQVTELESESDDAPGARLAMGLDWGRAALSGRGLLTPYGNLELSEDGARVYRLGSRFEIGPAIHIDLGGDRKEAADEAPEHGIDLSVRVDW